MKQRVSWVDMAKAIGMAIVIFNHLPRAWGMEELRLVNASFHMPLFFFLAGYVMPAARLRARDMALYVTKRALSILVPYVLWAMIFSYGITIINLKVIAYGSNLSLQKAGSNAVLWFLPAFFLSCVGGRWILSVLSRFVPGSGTWRVSLVAAMAVCITIGEALTAVRLPYDWPFSLNVAFVGTAFVLMGALLRELRFPQRVCDWKGPAQLAVLAGLVCVTVVAAFANTAVLQNDYGRVIMALGEWGNPVLFFASGVVGTLAIAALAIFLSRARFLQRALTSMGQVTMVMLVSHGILLDVLGKKLASLQGNVVVPFAITLVTLLICWGIGVLVQKVAPCLAGGSGALADAWFAPKKPASEADT